MVWIAQSIRVWFSNQIGLTQQTIDGLNALGINNPTDLSEYNEELLKQLKDDLRKPHGTIADPSWVAPPVVAGRAHQPVAPQIPRPGYLLSPISFMKLVVAADLIRFYEIVGRSSDSSNMVWTNHMTHYQQYMKARDKIRDEDEPKVPAVTRNLGITLWVDAFQLYLTKVYGCRDVPLAYVIREAEVPPPIDALVRNMPYGEATGSCDEELISRASHTDPMFSHDNHKVYELLEEALRTTVYASTMSGFKRTKNGRGVWLAILAQHVGRDKWESEATKQGNFIRTYKWKPTSNMTLESFVNKHRVAHTRMLRCADNIALQTMSERERVGHILEGISTSDQGLQAAIAQVRADDPAAGGGKRNNFEEAATYLIPFDPMKKKGGNKRDFAQIGAVKPDLNSTKGQTGVEVRFYKKNEYNQLTDEQKDELREIRKAQKEKKKSNKRSKTVGDERMNSKQRKALAKETSKHLIAALSEIDDDEDSTVKDFEVIVAAVQKEEEKDPKEAAVKIKAAMKEKGMTTKNLKSILRRGGKSDSQQ